MPAPEERVINCGAAPGAPQLSVVTPFHRHDPCALIAALRRVPIGVEIVLLDDGSGNAALLARAVSALSQTGAAARIVVWEANRGRSAARNRLIDEARGEYVLMLDADMMPDRADFLQRWLEIIHRERPWIAFGGLSLTHTAPTPETALHYNLFANSDCRSAEERARAPAQFTASANLLVRRDFLLDHPFDGDFAGWGFEDVDWALSASRHAPILHVDNSATHVGLDSVADLLRKSAEAGPNFARLARKHPEAVRSFAGHRAARFLSSAPARAQMRAAAAWLARATLAPMSMRRAALKLYRASHYAEHLA